MFIAYRHKEVIIEKKKRLSEAIKIATCSENELKMIRKDKLSLYYISEMNRLIKETILLMLFLIKKSLCPFESLPNQSRIFNDE